MLQSRGDHPLGLFLWKIKERNPAVELFNLFFLKNSKLFSYNACIFFLKGYYTKIFIIFNL